MRDDLCSKEKKHSAVEKLSLNIPWKHFSRSPTRIEIEGFSLLFASSDGQCPTNLPVRERSVLFLCSEMIIDEEEDEEKKYQMKMKELKKIEDFRKEREKQRNRPLRSAHLSLSSWE